MTESTLENPFSYEEAGLALKNKHPFKQVFDFTVALLVLVLISPVMLAAALWIKLTSAGPVLFTQQRVGLMGTVFTMYKFRTMDVAADTGMHQDHVTHLINNGQPMVKIDDHHRLIPGGKLLRRLCIDELPQLFNVLRSEMSLVGPRPAIPYEVQHYSPWHRRRLLALPGMTGLWQVSGKNRLTFDQMVQLDIQYTRTCSMWRDLTILLRTPWAILSEVTNRNPQNCN